MMADIKGIEPAHPLFRLVFGSAFNEGEKIALDIYLGKECAEGGWQKALEASVLNLWTDIAQMISRIADPRARKDIDEVLFTAAKIGNVAAMRLARDLGATHFNQTLDLAAYNGHIDAMREARAMGATNLDSALGSAAFYGQMAAVKEAMAMGAIVDDYALSEAAKGGHVEIMKVICSSAISRGTDLDFNRAFYCAAAEGHVDAMRLAVAMCKDSDQLLDLNAGLDAAAWRGHLAAVKEAITMGASDIGRAFDAACSRVESGLSSREIVDYLRTRL